jgi:hypothetical protein
MAFWSQRRRLRPSKVPKATVLLLISIPKLFAMPIRILGVASAILFFVTAGRIFLGEQLLPTATPLPSYDLHRLDLDPVARTRIAVAKVRGDSAVAASEWPSENAPVSRAESAKAFPE